jgi:hypothetical protein
VYLTQGLAVLPVEAVGSRGAVSRRRRSKRKKNQYIKLPRTGDMVQERMRQSRAAGKHRDDAPPRRHEILKQEDQDNG